MSIAPPIIPQPEVIEQIKGLTSQKDQLLAHLRDVEEKARLIEVSLAENAALKAKVNELLDQSLGFFQEEWNRKSNYYPDIRAQSLTKISELINPPKKSSSTVVVTPPGGTPPKKA